MSGLVAIFDWERSVDIGKVDPMLALVPHRAADGITIKRFDQAVLAEMRSARDATGSPSITSLQHLSIAADLRLWNRDSLRAMAGGAKATTGMDDRCLLLTAYLRTGIDFLDAVDGDFAFVIWDERERRLLAVRDRFGVKPLFFECTSSGIRFASEPKQLVATSTKPVEPHIPSIAGHLMERYDQARATFFEGINRVRPSERVIADAAGLSTANYWDPSLRTEEAPTGFDVPGGFRERLVDSVERRLASSTIALSDLTGGLDSSSITASADILASLGAILPPFHTASAVFPGHGIDESPWINEIAAGQPFEHHDFIPEIENIDSFESDMWIADSPRVIRIRGMWTGTRDLGLDLGADLLLTGHGGDDVLDEYDLLSDLLRSGSISRWMNGARSYAATYEIATGKAMLRSGKRAMPSRLKRLIQTLLPATPAIGLFRDELLRDLQQSEPSAYPVGAGFPSRTQNRVIAQCRDPNLVSINELQESLLATSGLEVSHPFLDRSLVEHIASIPITARPLDVRGKALVRKGLSDFLPRSVLDRRYKTVSDDYLDVVFAIQGREFRDRYPEVSHAGLAYLDAERYASMLEDTGRGPTDHSSRDALWSAWTLMMWLDGLDRYSHKTAVTPRLW